MSPRRGIPIAITLVVLAAVISAGTAISTCDSKAAAGEVTTVWSSFVKGVDVSSLPQVEESGGTFSDGGIAGDPLEILAGHGFDFVRLRLWHSPADGHCGLVRTLEMAARAERLGMGILLDLHYSDTWADPGRQDVPAAWTGLSPEVLADSVYRYTRSVVAALKRQGTPPDWVQIGNEVVCGMLWDEGRVCGPFDRPEQWDAFALLIKAGIDGAHDGAPGDTIRTMIHVDNGGDNAACVWFFDNLLSRGTGFDLIGLSFYPWWHGTLGDLASNMRDLASRYDREIVVVETAYPFTLGWNDGTHNIIGLEGQLHKGYPATSEGQHDFLDALADTISAVHGGRGIGFFYWEPAWISAPAAGSPWENLSLFDFSGEFHQDAHSP
ncbi:MAG TPA: glycosyl hydrolase 53 family protein [Candidatus Krumholzibacterium sp.]|nr:glycosyl hydrolase 53 family protein [Candidatus Krumholzibacterium sp.]